MTTRDVELLNAAVTQHLSEPTSWAEPVHFPHSLALCALNSIYSLNAKSKQGENVLARYRAHREKQNANADRDHAYDMLKEIERYGVETFAQRRFWITNGPSVVVSCELLGSRKHCKI